MGKHQLRLLKFLIRFQSSGWHTYGTDQSTVRAVSSLASMGLVELAPNRMMRLARPESFDRH